MGIFNLQTIGMIVGLVALGLGNASCDNEEGSEIATIGFSTLSSTASEADQTVEIQLSADRATSSDVQISFEVSGSAFLGGDYKLETNSPIIMEAGEQTVNILVRLIDESVIESTDDEVKFTLTSIGANALLSQSGDLKHTLIVRDDDSVPADQLQIDLTWDLGEGKDIDQVDFDLFLATDVVIENNAVTNAEIYTSSENKLGFETLWITEEDEDAEYYIVVNYSAGSVDADFMLNLNGGQGFYNESVAETFSASDAGSALFYGPLTKSGSSITRTITLKRLKTPLSY